MSLSVSARVTADFTQQLKKQHQFLLAFIELLTT
jgi:hypothetical protein